MFFCKIPIKTVSEANKHEHWTKAHKRHKMQKNAIYAILSGKLSSIKIPCKIKLIRIAPRKLDADDNLPMSFKFIKDYICSIIRPGLKPGRADDKGFIFEYDQKKGESKEYAIEIEICNL